MQTVRIETRARRSGPGKYVWIIAALFAILLCGRLAASLAIDYAWWGELGQLETWFGLFTYAYAPITAATLVAFFALWLAHRGAMGFASADRKSNPNYMKLAALVLLGLAYLIAASTLEGWTVVRFFGSRGIPGVPNEFHDPVFHLPLRFYLFDLPFYSALRNYLLALTILCALLFWAVARGWQLRFRFSELRDIRDVDLSLLRLPGGLESRFLRGALSIVLIALACRYFLGRYEMVFHDHTFMVGIDWLEDHVTLPLQWVLIAACLAGCVFAWLGKWRFVIAMALTLPIVWIIPKLTSVLYVKPNEISLESPYIGVHIHATRNGFGIENRVNAVEYRTDSSIGSLDVAAHRNLLDNVRLWDWRAFHDTVTQSQALRPYYVFHDTDVDRYTINGDYRETLMAPRELDISQVRDPGWINPRFIYTHGYGAALAEVSKLTPEGLPVFLIENMPPEIKTPSLKISRPQLYFSEVSHEPVFVRTAQEEFDYPSGADNVKDHYEGSGGFPISSFPMRLAAAVHEGDFNILLTDYLTGNSRMMIHRHIVDRVSTLAPFLEWDPDPYLVIAPDGRFVWMLDGYTTSDNHPYSREVEMPDGSSVNYIRNSVKATVDAYDGTVHFYVFDPSDPLIQAYRSLFPSLFLPESSMPEGLRAHARYPELLFRAQAEMYRTYHMLNPQAFYNHEDLWDLARSASGQEKTPEAVNPTYVVATLPGEQKPEFLLMTSFTPTSKENLIGVMLARCDGPHLGEIRVLQLSKQELTLGPMQISARINQDQNISKDLTLWNQQGSQVLRGQMLVLPVDHTFLYVEPIYIQATEARMPQLRKIVLAVGNRLIYTDTYEEALAQLNGSVSAAAAPEETRDQPGQSGAPASPVPVTGTADARLTSVRAHFQRYLALTAQGKLADAGRELDAINQELK